MNVKTRFNPGDKVYVMYNNELSLVQIREVKSVSTSSGTSVTYLVTKIAKSYQANLTDWFEEKRLFKSKTALVKNLLNA